MLLSRKVPVSAKNKSKKRAEGLAKKSGHKEIVALLAHVRTSSYPWTMWTDRVRLLFQYEKLKIKATTVMTAVRDKSFPDAKLDVRFFVFCTLLCLSNLLCRQCLKEFLSEWWIREGKPPCIIAFR